MVMLALHGSALGQALPAGPVRYDHHKLVRAHLKTQQELDAMLALGARPWDCITGVGAMEFSLSPDAFARLKAGAISFELLNDDIQPMIDADIARMQHPDEPPGARGGIAGVDWFSDFKTYPQVNGYIDGLVALRPDLASKVTIGTTIQGRTIYGMRISGSAGPGSKPAVIFSGCQHAREWIAVMVPMYIADALVRRYDSDAQIHALMDRVEFFIVPIVNPDGYEYTYATNGDRLWRKNRHVNIGGSYGVDLNRNWSVDWNGGHSTSTDPNSEVYVGTAAFSEPETVAVRDFITARPQIVGHIDFHSYAQLVLENWAHMDTQAPDYDLIDAIGTDMNQSIYAANAVNYNNGWGGSLLYLASGVFPDWSYGVRGILGYTIELRDTGQNGFILPPDQIVPTCTESLPAALHLADWVTRGAQFFFPRSLPATVAAGATTTVPVTIQGIAGAIVQSGTAKVFVRTTSTGPFTSYPLNSLGGNSYQAVLPAAVCGRMMQYYFQVQTAAGATVTSPATAPASLYQSRVVNPVTTYNFETNPGWTTQNLGASAGQWQRGVPVNDPNWPYDPATDADGSGQCYLTQNMNGQYTDVTNGSVRLISPALNLASVPANVVISYAYYLHLTTPGPNDPMVIEISSNDLAGPWTEIARHDTSGSSQWRSNAIAKDALTALGVSLTSTMRLRFTVSDGGPQSIVESALDNVRISSDCGGPPPSCIADIAPAGGDLVVNVDDLLAVINSWGPCPPAGNPCIADIAPSLGNGTVNVDDLLAVINAWGPCP